MYPIGEYWIHNPCAKAPIMYPKGVIGYISMYGKPNDVINRYYWIHNQIPKDRNMLSMWDYWIHNPYTKAQSCIQ
jgi:hypothetical protein